MQYGKDSPRYWANRIKRQGKAGTWKASFSREGKQRTISLLTGCKMEASKRAAVFWADLNGEGGWVAAVAGLRGGSVPGAFRDGVTLREWLALVEAHCSHLAPRTLTTYRQVVLRITRDIMRVEGAKGEPEDWDLTQLTSAKIDKWRTAYIKASPSTLNSATRSVNGYILKARALFSMRAVETIKLHGGRIPNPIPFANYTPPRKPKPQRYVSKIIFTELLIKGETELGRDAFLLLVLSLGAGLRRSEADKLTWAQVFLESNPPLVSIEETPYFTPKTAFSERSIPLGAFIAEKLKERLESTTFVLRGKEFVPAAHYSQYRCPRAQEELIEWLRGKGVTDRKPIHMLRKEYGSIITASAGIRSAQELLGHSDISVTASVYSDARVLPTVDL